MHDQYPENAPQLGSTYMGVEIPANYMPIELRFTDNQDLWSRAADYEPGGRDSTPESVAKRQAAERQLATSIDNAYDKHSAVVTTGEDGRQHAQFFLDEDRTIGVLNLSRFTTSDGTLVDTMSYRRVGGGTWDSSQILLRAPGAEPRLIGAVTNRKTGEVVAMPPGGYYGTNSEAASQAELWTRNFEQAIAKRPSRREMMARAIARLLDNDYR